MEQNKKVTNLNYSEKIKNLEASFMDLILEDDAEAIEVLNENKIDVESLKRRMLEKIKKISCKEKNIILTPKEK